jgi:hypothetical protein
MAKSPERSNRALVMSVCFITMILLATIPAYSMEENAAEEVQSRGSLPGLPLPQTQAFSIVTADCLPIQVLTNRTSVRIQCGGTAQTNAGVPQNFAVSLDDPGFVARILKLAISAQVAGHRMSVWYDRNDTSGDRIGCSSKDCRLITQIALTQAR